MHAQSDLFKEFGEKSPLETMHASKTIATATAEGSNILAGLSEEDVRLPNSLRTGCAFFSISFLFPRVARDVISCCFQRRWVCEVVDFAILGTDMASHFDIMQDFNTRCERDGGLTDSRDDRKVLLRMLLKVSAC